MMSFVDYWLDNKNNPKQTVSIDISQRVAVIGKLNIYVIKRANQETETGGGGVVETL